jgi:hypothetical protein
MNKSIYEIIEEFEEIPVDDEERLMVLQQYSTHTGFRNWLQGVFHPGVKFHEIDISDYKPEEIPPGMGYTTFDNEFKRMYLFVKGHPKCPPGLTEKRRKELFLQILEALEPDEAQMVINMVNKKTGVKHLTKKLVKQAMPDLNLED